MVRWKQIPWYSFILLISPIFSPERVLETVAVLSLLFADTKQTVCISCPTS